MLALILVLFFQCTLYVMPVGQITYQLPSEVVPPTANRKQSEDIITERHCLISEFALLEATNTEESNNHFRLRIFGGKLHTQIKEIKFLGISNNQIRNSINSCYSDRIYPLLV